MLVLKPCGDGPRRMSLLQLTVWIEALNTKPKIGSKATMLTEDPKRSRAIVCQTSLSNAWRYSCIVLILAFFHLSAQNERGGFFATCPYSEDWLVPRGETKKSKFYQISVSASWWLEKKTSRKPVLTELYCFGLVHCTWWPRRFQMKLRTLMLTVWQGLGFFFSLRRYTW